MNRKLLLFVLSGISAALLACGALYLWMICGLAKALAH